MHSYSKYCAQKERALICGEKKEKADLVYGEEKSDVQAGIEEFAGTVWPRGAEDVLNCHLLLATRELLLYWHTLLWAECKI